MATLIITYCVIKACVIVWRDPEPMPEDMCWTVVAAIERARPGVSGHCLPTTPGGDRPAEQVFNWPRHIQGGSP